MMNKMVISCPDEVAYFHLQCCLMDTLQREAVYPALRGNLPRLPIAMMDSLSSKLEITLYVQSPTGE